ncbi:MAG: terminase large subunit domain-containing protein [Opitutales bacterium]
MFLPYQRRWIADRARLKLMEKSRQIGMSWCAAYALVRRQSASDCRLDAWVASRDDIQARLFIEDCLQFAQILNLAATELAQPILQESGRSATNCIEFTNTRRIHSLSSNADAQAGKRGARLLDEFALHPDPRHLYAIALPGITWGGQLEIISTHRGGENYFNQLIREITEAGNPKGFSHHRVTLEDALDQGLLERLQAKLPKDDARARMDRQAYFDHIQASCPDRESFLQEYMCQPADDAAAFLPADLIAACEYPLSQDDGRADATAQPGWAADLSDPHAANRKHLAQRSFHVGIDIGRDHDLTVIWVLETVEDVHFTRQVIELQGLPFSEQEALVEHILSLPRACATIDQTGIGRQFAERASQRFGARRVSGVTFTQALKEELAYTVRIAFEDRRIRIPQTKSIRSDLRAIRRETSVSGRIRFTADRGKNGHADRFWALALALHAARAPLYSTAHYESVAS